MKMMTLALLLAGGPVSVHDFRVAHLDSGVKPTSAGVRKRTEGVLPSRGK